MGREKTKTVISLQETDGLLHDIWKPALAKIQSLVGWVMAVPPDQVDSYIYWEMASNGTYNIIRDIFIEDRK